MSHGGHHSLGITPSQTVGPFLAIALGLKARGHEAVVATGECYRRKVEALGVEVSFLTPESFRTVGLPSYRDLRVALPVMLEIQQLVSELDRLQVDVEGLEKL